MPGLLEANAWESQRPLPRFFWDGQIVSANYINKMSDYCRSCHYDHQQRAVEDACPFNFLYWNFFLEHEATLRANPRLGRNVLGLRHLDEPERQAVRRQAQAFLYGLDYVERT